MIELDITTPGDMARRIAQNCRACRKRNKLSMKKLAELSDVSFASVRRFEETGEIALTSLLRIAAVLHQEEEFLSLFTACEITSIREIIDGTV